MLTPQSLPFFCSLRYLNPAYSSDTDKRGEKWVRKNYLGVQKSEV